MTSRGTDVPRPDAAFTSPMFRADHHPGERRGGFLAGIAGRDLFAAAQDGRGVAEAFDLVELVTDVKDGSPLALEPLEHDEELIGLLRGEHGSRLIENQEFRILHERAHDLDALALADRKPPDFPLGIERQAV